MGKILELIQKFDRLFVLSSEKQHLRESEGKRGGNTVLANCIESSTCPAFWTGFVTPYFAAFASLTIHYFVLFMN